MAPRTSALVLTFGLDAAGRASFTVTHRGRMVRVVLVLHSAHQVSNATAAAAVAIGLGASVRLKPSRAVSIVCEPLVETKVSPVAIPAYPLWPGPKGSAQSLGLLISPKWVGHVLLYWRSWSARLGGCVLILFRTTCGSAWLRCCARSRPL